MCRAALPEYGKTPAQVVLSWGANHQISVVPKSTNEKRLKENIGIFELEADDLVKLDGIDKNIRYNDASEDFGYSSVQPTCALLYSGPLLTFHLPDTYIPGSSRTRRPPSWSRSRCSRTSRRPSD